MQLPTDITTYAQWSGYGTIAFLVLTIIAFIAGWGFRFRLVGITSFMGVVTASIFGLGLGLFSHTAIPGAVRYSLVYDNGANNAVVTVSPEIETSAIEPTLRQASIDLYSYGRTGANGNDNFTVKLRTVLHPDTGVSQPLFLGQATRSLSLRDESNLKVEVFTENLAQLPQNS
ncbi:MAG: Ycf51 family protein [Xenococcaceae cyanobacterium MO_207.B15]|nr:Ycf51 family protein [Xenococcaceae cyanobacterium MO_207.B15]